jgi:hypothetical protein
MTCSQSWPYQEAKNATLDFNKLNKNKIGVIWGSGNGGIHSRAAEDFLKEISIRDLILILFQRSLQIFHRELFRFVIDCGD